MRGSVPLGTTPTGIEWAMKALHPAGEGTPSGIPDQFARPTAKWMITSTQQFSAPEGGSGNSWDLDLIGINHPLFFAYYHSIWGAGDSQGTVYNPAIFSSNPSTFQQYVEGTTQFINMVERYRPMYAAMTCTPVVSSLSNQGSVTVAQYPLEPRYMSIDHQPDTASADGKAVKGKKKEEDEDVGSSTTAAAVPLPIRTTSRNPYHTERALKTLPPSNAVNTRIRSQLETWSEYYADLSSLTVLPNSYVGQFKDGVYTVLKFTGDFDHWQNTRSLYTYLGTSGASAIEAAPCTADIAPTAASTNSFPYVIPQYSLSGSGWPVLPRCEHNVMQCSFRGLDPAAAVKVTFRMAFECEVLPTSTIAPFVSSPAEPDAAALYAYALITRRMKDGYPEAYNSWEKLVDVIKMASKAAGVVIPGAGLIGDAADWMYKTFSSKGKSGMLPEERAEHVRDQTKKASKLKIQRPSKGISPQDIAKIIAATKGKPKKQHKGKK